MLVSGRVVLWTLLVGFASATPQCVESGTSRVTYTCSGFTRHTDFDIVRREFTPDRYRRVDFVLQNSNLDYLPPSAFAGTMPSSLEFQNVRVHGTAPATLAGLPFDGVTQWVKHVTFSDGSTAPPSWSLLAPLTKLEDLNIKNMHYFNLSNDFNHLPQGLKHLRVLDSTIANVEAEWLSNLPNLESLQVENSNLNYILRSMLPTPALNLTSLTLRNANLTSLPLDLTDELPHLRELNLQNNSIHHFRNESFAPLLANFPNAAVHLEGNPLDCDCQARFLNQIPPSWTTPPCNTPQRLKGRYVPNIGISQLLCENQVASGARK
ncbi:toll-like receptor 9 [Haemaphysalis longicornis]